MSLFHKRKQKSGETVDESADELRHLHQRTYPESLRGSKDAERMAIGLTVSLGFMPRN